MIEGLYEELVTKLVKSRLDELDQNVYYIKTKVIDREEAALFLSRHLFQVLKQALKERPLEKQIEIANELILTLKKELNKQNFEDDLVEIEGKVLEYISLKVNSHYFGDLGKRVDEITPLTRLTHSELFTGGNVGLSLESELKREILSSDQVDLLVSFIKFKGVIILKSELEQFTRRGGKLRVLTTTYMGASDLKAIKLLAELDNTQIKISYNTGNERLHAKAYLFKRNTGFHTGYIGSSNFSRSALTDGLEWNLKITTKEVGHIIDKFQKTFDTYWQSTEFEEFILEEHEEKLRTSLQVGKSGTSVSGSASFFEIKPFPFQQEILEKLEIERSFHARNRNLVVAATGTGKTVISAFDFQAFLKKNGNAKLLFIAHRKEILDQALFVFRGILRNNNFGESWYDGLEPTQFEHIFATIQTLNSKWEEHLFPENYFDFIVIDECHHLTANSYRKLIQYFTPKVLLGLTATPERMDGGDIKEDFHHRIAAEIRLPEALNRKLLCPFQYFGISDSVDLSKVGWEKGRYIPSELSSVYMANDRRVAEVIQALDTYTKDATCVKALGFCAGIDHARYMAEKFSLAGFKAAFLTSKNDHDRDQIKDWLEAGKINYLFVVDIFNEGIDIPAIDTVLFLRPTESLTIFLQQLGRGLRLHAEKECLTVLDFVGNARPEYNFENKFRALIGKTSTTVKKELENNFPHLPLGCSIVLERKAKEYILENITAATQFNRRQIINKIQVFDNMTTLPLTLKNFIEFNNLPLQLLYTKGSWKKLCHEAGKLAQFHPDPSLEKAIVGAISNKWLACNSSSYFQFIYNLAERNFNVSIDQVNETEKKMLLMLYYDVWQDAQKFESLEKGIQEIGKDLVLVEEIKELLEILLDKIDFKELDVELPYEQPLKIHSRYTRDQILSAFGLSTFEKKSSNREGVALNDALNTELLFINLIKSEERFSPTTMYEDYAISEDLFHWQCQNATGIQTPKGQSYIHHKKNNKRILLFIREQEKDEFNNTMGYVFVGEGVLDSYHGSKPMTITWKLKTPLPHYLWKDVAKLSVG
ncbi:MAG: DUF3427 domain-containing protein [Spirosomataceae bacterium]